MINHYRKHVFFCVNQRAAGKQCCQNHDAEAMREYAKHQIKAKGLAGVGGIRVNASGCLGRCAEGPSVVIYPEGVWYSYHSQADIDEIIQTHLMDGQIVTRLLMSEIGNATQ